MSFWQRAFDEFWNSYKPIERIRINFDHDKVSDQYSIGDILNLKGILAAALPDYLRTNSDFQVLAKYANEFKHIEVLDRFGEIPNLTRIEFKGAIVRLAVEHNSDTALVQLYRKIVQTGSDALFNLFAKAVTEDVLPHRSSNKLTIVLKDEVAQLYNHNSRYEGVNEVNIKLGTSIMIRTHDINITRIFFSTLKNVSVPGFSISVGVETNQIDETNRSPDEISIHVSKGPLSYSKWFNITSLTFEPKILLTAWKPSGDVENIYKRVFLDFEPNIKVSITPNLKLPDWVAEILYTFINSDYVYQSSTEIVQNLANEKVREFMSRQLNASEDRIISTLLGDVYPIIDIQQINDNMFITYVPKPEDEKFLKITPKEYKPAKNLSKFDHIVVVMMENRSFDHMLGYLKVEEGRQDVDGLTGNESNMDIERKVHKVFHNIDTQIHQDPCHSHECVLAQIGTNMDGFVKNFCMRYTVRNNPNNRNIWKNVMSYYGKYQVPSLDYIANNFAICDRWFCSHPGQTMPNRFISYTGKLNKDYLGNTELDNFVFDRLTPIETYTIFDYLTRCKVSWKVFEHGYSSIRLFTNYMYDTANVVYINNPRTGFFALAAQGKLPSVTFIEPDYIDVPPGNDDHPPADIRKGQAFLGKVINAIQKSPQWEKTLLVITYDEHGGFYDHVMPPDNALPLAEGLARYGPRVPALVVSPYVPAKAVSHELFDHTSILATIMRRFIHPDLYQFIDLGPRVAVANDLGSLLTLETGRKLGSDFNAISVMSYQDTHFTRTYKMQLPAMKSNEYHETLFGYRLLFGFPPK